MTDPTSDLSFLLSQDLSDPHVQVSRASIRTVNTCIRGWGKPVSKLSGLEVSLTGFLTSKAQLTGRLEV